MGKTDTIHHHILECPTHEHLRVMMFQRINSSAALNQYLKSARKHHPTKYPDNELSTHSRKRKESAKDAPKKFKVAKHKQIITLVDFYLC